MTTLSCLMFPDPSCAPRAVPGSGAPASPPASFRVGAHGAQDTLAQLAFLSLQQSNSSLPQGLCTHHPVQDADSTQVTSFLMTLTHSVPCSYLFCFIFFTALDHSLKFLFSCLLSVSHELECKVHENRNVACLVRHLILKAIPASELLHTAGDQELFTDEYRAATVAGAPALCPAACEALRTEGKWTICCAARRTGLHVICTSAPLRGN